MPVVIGFQEVHKALGIYQKIHRDGKRSNVKEKNKVHIFYYNKNNFKIGYLIKTNSYTVKK